MRRDDFEFLMLALMVAAIASVFVVGDVLLREIQRRPRVVGIVSGGKEEHEVDERETG